MYVFDGEKLNHLFYFQLSGDVLSSLVDELFKIEDKKSYLKAVCEAVLRDLVQQVSARNV